MKRKVKFQEGGAVEEPSRRSRSLRQMMEKASREGGRLRAAERARERQVAEREAARQSRIDRQDIARFNERMDRAMPVTPEEARRLGAEPARPRPTMAQAAQQVTRPPSPAATSTAGRVAGGLAGAAISGAALVPGIVDYGRRFAERRGAEADARREANLQAFRNQERAAMEQERGEAGDRMPTPRPAAAPRPAARPAPARPPASRIREMSFDELNEMELRRIRAERQMEEDEARRNRARRQPEEEMGGSGNIGAASARERGEQVGPPGDYNNFKKGGIVKKKAGGMIAAKPKAKAATYKKGGAVAKPKTKAMPFKKGGKISMKGRK